MKKLIKLQVKNRNKKKLFAKYTYRLTIPKAIVEALGWKNGDLISITIGNNKQIILKKSSRVTEIKDMYKGSSNEMKLSFC